jgi:MFS family permease
MNASSETIRPAAARWMLLLLVLANVLSVGDRMLLGVVTEPIRLELALSDVQMSLASGFFFVLFHLGGGFVVARMVDRGNRKRILVIGIVVWSLATAATGLANDFLSLSIARVGLGIAEAAVFPAAMSLIPDLFDRNVRGRAMATFQTSGFLGVMVCTSIAGLLAGSLGWRSMFVLFGLAGIAFALLVQLTGKEPARGHHCGQTQPPPPYMTDLFSACGRVLVLPGFACLALAFGVAAMVAASTGTWGPAFLQRSHGVSLAQVGFAIGLSSGIGGIAGTLLAGVLIDALAKRNHLPSAMLRIPIVVLPLCTPFLLGFLFSPDLGVTVACAGILSFLLGCGVAPCVTHAVTCVIPADRGIASIVMLAAAGLIGSALGPFLIAAVSDLLADRLGNESLRYALSVLVLAPLVSAALLAVALRQMRAQACIAAGHARRQVAAG